MEMFTLEDQISYQLNEILDAASENSVLPQFIEWEGNGRKYKMPNGSFSLLVTTENEVEGIASHFWTKATNLDA